MMLRYSVHLENAAAAIELAIEKVLKRGARTADIPGRQRPSSTTRMGDLIAEETRKLLKSAKFRPS
jgi:3-isopropylmalate dehydrogenase